MAFLKNLVRLPLVPAVLSIAIVFSVARAQDAELVLNNPDAYPEKQRTAVTFSHESHMDNLDCLACHHDYDDSENILDEDELFEGNPELRCAACHDPDTGVDLKAAFHGQCMGCHRQRRLAGAATGPELCGECHVKQ